VIGSSLKDARPLTACSDAVENLVQSGLIRVSDQMQAGAMRAVSGIELSGRGLVRLGVATPLVVLEIRCIGSTCSAKRPLSRLYALFFVLKQRKHLSPARADGQAAGRKVTECGLLESSTSSGK
jgi:hypothetical protein